MLRDEGQDLLGVLGTAHDQVGQQHVVLVVRELGPVGPAEALAVLSANVYVHYARDADARRSDLDFFADLVERVPVRGLPRAATLDAVEERVDNLLEDLTTAASASPDVVR